MLAEFDKYRTILLKDRECSLGTTLVACYQQGGVLLTLTTIVLESDSVTARQGNQLSYNASGELSLLTRLYIQLTY